jgi:DNA mismatch repair protein PMS2
VALTEAFDSARSSFVLNATQLALALKEEDTATGEGGAANGKGLPLFIPDDEDQNDDGFSARTQDAITINSDGELMPTEDSSITPLTQELATTLPSDPDEPFLAQKRPRSVSPDLVLDEGEDTSEMVRSPSQAPTPTQASSTSSQRLAGPGRTPARVEQILSENTSGSRRAVQMVLDTSGASWNLKPGQEGPPRKRPHLADATGSSSGKSARVNMRARLAGFARDGARIAQDREDEGDDDSPEEEEDGAERGAMDEEERLRSSSPKKMDVDADVTEPEIGDEGQSSTDVVEETMAVDSSESEDDEPSKPPIDSSHSVAAATAASSNSGQAADDLTFSTDLLLNSLSDSGASSKGVVTAAPSSPSKASGVQTEVVRTIVGDAPPLAFDLERTTNSWHAYLERMSLQPQPPQPATRSSDLEGADLGADDEKATAALARVLSKADFGSMEVVGQFNRGFIVARLCKIGGGGEGSAATDDLFIVDQHAADEKYNFETLQATTRLESQRLFT